MGSVAFLCYAMQCSVFAMNVIWYWMSFLLSFVCIAKNRVVSNQNIEIIKFFELYTFPYFSMVSDEKVMSTCSKRIHEVKHTLHLNDESKHFDTGIFTFNFHVHFHVQFSRSISTFTFRNKNTGLTNRCLKLTIHRTEPYSLMSLLYFCGHLEYIPGAHPCREMFGFQLFTQKKAPSQIP